MHRGVLPKKGWYQDPQNPYKFRYWDGQRWLDKVKGSDPKPQTSNKPASTLSTTALFWGQFLSVTIVVTGLLFAGVASWQLWGTNLVGSYEQQKLKAQIENPAFDFVSNDPYAVNDPLYAPPNKISSGPIGSSSSFATASSGEAIGRVKAPSINLDQILVKGTSPRDLNKGPGWMIGTPQPGKSGNSVISGHRTTHGAPFRNLDRLKTGDKITVSSDGSPDAVYEVRASFIVGPKDVWVTRPTSGARLTLTTCTPAGSDTHRLIIQAELVEGPAASVATPISEWQPSKK